MFKDLTYKKKALYLLITAIVALFIVYKMAIKETVTKKRNYKEIKAEIEKAENAPSIIAGLNKRIEAYNKLLGEQNQQELSVRDLLLNYGTQYCHDTRAILKNFPEPHIYKSSNYEIETNTMVVQGGFIELLKMLYALETNNNFGRIQSVIFQTEMNIRTKQKVLISKLYLQNIKHYDNEN